MVVKKGVNNMVLTEIWGKYVDLDEKEYLVPMTTLEDLSSVLKYTQVILTVLNQRIDKDIKEIPVMPFPKVKH